MAIGLSHGGTNVYSASERSDQLWVATQDGFVRFERTGTANGAKPSARCAASISARSSSRRPPAPCSPARFSARSTPAPTAARLGSGATTACRSTMSTAWRPMWSTAKSASTAGTQPAHLFVSEDLGMHWRELPSMREVPSVDPVVFPRAAACRAYQIHHLRSARSNRRSTPASSRARF